MLNELQENDIQCPYCGEHITVLIDASVSEQNYIEDCQVCCRPIKIDVFLSPENSIDLRVSHENE